MLLGNEFFKVHPEITDVIIHNAMSDVTKLSSDKVITRMMPSEANMVTTRSQSRACANDSVDSLNELFNEPSDSPSQSQGGASNRRQSNDVVVSTPSAESSICDVSKQTRVLESAINNQTTDPIKTTVSETTLAVDSAENHSANSQRSIANLNITTHFIEEQQTDASIEHLRHLARDGHPSYIMESGLLFKIAPTWLNTEVNKLLIVPSKFRPEVLLHGHSTIWAGHRGIKRTKDAISKYYYWPNMSKEIALYVKSCPTCQKIDTVKKTNRAPLIPIPLIGEIFDEVVVDILGPIKPVSKTGKQWILVQVCQASRWPEAVALSNIKADTVADALLHIWSRTGIPRTLRHDCGTNFMSKLMAAVESRLGIKDCVSTVFHHESIGVTERFNYTLHQMMRAFAHENPSDWPDRLNQFLFAYREVPHATTGLAPAEIVYNRSNFRGPLAILRDTWTHPDGPESGLKRNVLSYLIQTRDRLESAANYVKQHAEQQQAVYKTYYDKHSKRRILEAGDKVLVLMPTSTNSMLAQWQGPFTVIERVGEVNYIIDLGRRKTTLHINMLKKWLERPETVNAIIVECENDDNDVTDYPICHEFDNGTIKWEMGRKLTSEQKQQLTELLAKYEKLGLFSNKPGRTHLIEHEIRLTDNQPCVQAPYKVPDALKDQVSKQLDEMLEQGLIRESFSSFAAPLVIIKKRDSDSLRLVCDWRKLNSKTIDDQYPMRDPRDIIAKAGRAKYISSIDMCQGFFNIPIAEHCKHFTAFRCFKGLFEYNVLGMGLKTASQTQQRLLDGILHTAEDHASPYVDDVIIYSDSWDLHINHIHDVLQRIHEAGLTIKASKCQWALERLHCLGYIIEDKKIKPDDAKIEAIKNAPTPATKKQLRCWLGLIGYYRSLIRGHSALSFSLTELLKKSSPEKLQWGPKHQDSFEKLRSALLSEPVLVPPNPSKPYIVQTDASTTALGAILCQLDDDGKEHVVEYASRKLLPREQKYSTVELELLCLVWALKKWEHFVYNTIIQVQTDHSPLTWLNSLTVQNSRLTRYSLYLQRFNLNITHKKGILNTNCDALSRL